MFLCHLSTNRSKVTDLKTDLESWGVSSFIAHQDIEPSREWQSEIEAALTTMDVLIAVIEPGFRESAWTDQEVGFALGRGVDVVPLLIGLDPHGFISKIQGLQVKGKLPRVVADELALILLKRPKHRQQMLLGLSKALSAKSTEERRARIREIDVLVTDEQMKTLLERSGLTSAERGDLKEIVSRVGAFEHERATSEALDDIPF